MFGLEYVLALMKVAINIAFALVTAIPFTIAWNGIAPKYFYFIPPLFQHFPYWHVVGFFLICTFIGEQIHKLVPTIISIEQNSKEK